MLSVCCGVGIIRDLKLCIEYRLALNMVLFCLDFAAQSDSILRASVSGQYPLGSQ